ncbi:4Fe-4S binding protein [Natranaerofaba carboxydovora]|uniref:4Fe-4S binding protein n=1 Tax=Natranaerofaba carboxydovora TaxID=2742683 RepID=UPI001F145C2D|nr:4Fe-4S binding protein [Natranaerofaba carboxydovora]
MEITPTTREYEKVYEYCTMCGVCISRCPEKAITEEGKDSNVCKKYFDEKIYPEYFPRYGCGKCQTAVPCEKTNPNKKKY